MNCRYHKINWDANTLYQEVVKNLMKLLRYFMPENKEISLSLCLITVLKYEWLVTWKYKFIYQLLVNKANSLSIRYQRPKTIRLMNVSTERKKERNKQTNKQTIQ